jgi:phosphatidylinositol 4-kinase
MLLDFDNEEEAKSSMTPKLCCEIIGVSQWDGQGRANQYPNGFLLVSHTGVTYYVSVTSKSERDEWILHVRRGLEFAFANVEMTPYKPSKISQNRPPISTINICNKTRNTINNLSSATYCLSCGRPYSSSEYVQDHVSMLQIGLESPEKVCTNCRNAQACVLWLKTLNYVHAMTMHELIPIVLQDVSKFKTSFKLRRRQSSRLDMAANMLEQGKITLDEFEELRRVDHDYRRELLYEESERLKIAIDAIGKDMQTIIGLLLNPTTTENGGRMSYLTVILKILEIADNEPELIDFYWPQLVQAHFLEAANRSPINLTKVDLLQQALLAISQKYPPLALKLAWSLLATISDFGDKEKKVTQVQYGACVTLLLQLEMIMTGSISAIADVPLSSLLANVIRPASHHQQEIGYEISILFIIRRRLQELHLDDEAERKKRNTPINSPAVTPNNNGHRKNSINAAGSMTCLALMHQLGVGQAPDRDNDNDIKITRSTSSDMLSVSASREDDLEDHSRHKNCYQWSSFGDQLDFIERLTDLVDKLRFVDRPLRTEMLCKALTKLNENMAELGWDPTASAGEPFYRIKNINIEDCRVFRTKARAPSLIVCEVVREDLDVHLSNDINRESDISKEGKSDNQKNDSRSNSPGKTPSKHRAHTSSFNEIENISSLVDSSIHQVIADIHKTQAENIIRNSSKDHDSRSPSIDVNDSDVLSLKEKFDNSITLNYDENDNDFSVRRALRRPSSTPSLLPANRKMSSLQSIVGSASTEDLQLLSISDVSLMKNSLENDINDKGRESDMDAVIKQKVFESAQRLLESGKIDQNEFEELIKSDSRFRDESAKEVEAVALSKVESAFGETWQSKKGRILGDRDHPNDQKIAEDNSPILREWQRWDLRCFIVKSNDDLRQEMCCLQLMKLCNEIFIDFGLGSQLWLKPYRIVSTGSSTGIVQVLNDTMSIDALKKGKGFTTLSAYFNKTYGSSEELLYKAKRNFAASLAAYSLFTYILLVKDRHNGNMLIDIEGHIIHIDFGFLLAIAPGGLFSLETAPFKLTEEMVDVLGGIESPLFGEFTKSFTAGFLALRANCEDIVNNLQILAMHSPFPCFVGKDSNAIIDKLRSRFRCELSVKDVVQHCLDLIVGSYGHLGTRQYDSYQYYTNGIFP